MIDLQSAAQLHALERVYSSYFWIIVFGRF